MEDRLDGFSPDDVSLLWLAAVSHVGHDSFQTNRATGPVPRRLSTDEVVKGRFPTNEGMLMEGLEDGLCPDDVIIAVRLAVCRQDKWETATLLEGRANHSSSFGCRVCQSVSA